MTRIANDEAVRGFSLIEALVALAVIGMAVIMLATIVGHEPRALRRIEAHREAYDVLFGAIESVRAGNLSASALDGADPAAWLPSRPSARNVRLEAETSVINPRGLSRLRVTVFYDTVGAKASRSVETLLWRRSP